MQLCSIVQKYILLRSRRRRENKVKHNRKVIKQQWSFMYISYWEETLLQTAEQLELWRNVWEEKKCEAMSVPSLSK